MHENNALDVLVSTSIGLQYHPALQRKSERGVRFRVTSPQPQRLKPNTFAVGILAKGEDELVYMRTRQGRIRIDAALQTNSERFQQVSGTVPVFRAVHFRVTNSRLGRLKPNRFAVGS